MARGLAGAVARPRQGRYPDVRKPGRAAVPRVAVPMPLPVEAVPQRQDGPAFAVRPEQARSRALLQQAARPRTAALAPARIAGAGSVRRGRRVRPGMCCRPVPTAVCGGVRRWPSPSSSALSSRALERIFLSSRRCSRSSAGTGRPSIRADSARAAVSRNAVRLLCSTGSAGGRVGGAESTVVRQRSLHISSLRSPPDCRLTCCASSANSAPCAIAVARSSEAPSQRAANAAHAGTRALGEQAMATLKTWRLLRKLRCSTTRITSYVQAILTLHLTCSN